VTTSKVASAKGRSVTDRDPVVQPDKPIEPAGCFAVLLGEVDGGYSAPILAGEEAGCPADPAAGVEHLVLPGDLGKFGQLACGDSAHCVKILERAQIIGRKVVEVLSGGDEGMFDVAPGQAG